MLNLMRRPSLAATTALTVGVFSLGSVQVLAQDLELDSDQKKYSYAVGTKMAEQLLQQFGQADSGMDMQALAAGITDTVNNGDRKLTAEEADAAIAAQQQKMLEEATATAEEAARRSEEFLDENAAGEGVVVTDSGLQYRVLESGDESAAMPTVDDTVVVHYKGTLIDGTEFDSSYARGEPATFPLNGIIPGWIEVLQLMRPGDKWEVVIPSALAYGEQGAGNQIGPNEALIFDIELLEIK